jgi:hypothetical protein
VLPLEDAVTVITRVAEPVLKLSGNARPRAKLGAELVVVAAGRAAVVVCCGVADNGELDTVARGEWLSVGLNVGLTTAALDGRSDALTVRVVPAGVAGPGAWTGALVIGRNAGRVDETAAVDGTATSAAGRLAARPIPTATAAPPATATAAQAVATTRAQDTWSLWQVWLV